MINPICYTSGRGIMFHHFTDAIHPSGQGALTADQFSEMIDFLSNENLLSAKEWIERARRGTLSEGDIVLTFDDGLRCQIDVALPVLEQRGLKACWFVYSGVFEGQVVEMEIYRYFRTTQFDKIDEFYEAFEREIGEQIPELLNRPEVKNFDPDAYLNNCPYYTSSDRKFRYLRDQVLTYDQYGTLMDAMISASPMSVESISGLLWMEDADLVNLAKRGHVVGLHSYSHPTKLVDKPADEQRYEYENNQAHLTRVLGHAPKTMSHPCNSYSGRTLQILQELDVDVGFRADMELANNGALEYPREDHAIVLERMTST